MLPGKRATHVADRQRLWFLELRHVSWTSIVIPSVLRDFVLRNVRHVFLIRASDFVPTAQIVPAVSKRLYRHEYHSALI